MGCEQSEPTEPYYPQSFHRKPVLFFALGGPGSGKASYCERLVADYRLKYLSVKDLVQFEAGRHTAYSRQIKECINKGNLIPSETITRLIKKAIAHYGPRAFLIDGFPRNLENTQSFELLLAKEVHLLAVVYFDCSETRMYEKILKDGGDSISEEKIRGLMQLYETEVLPVVRHFALKDVLIRINTELHQQFDKNYEEVRTALKLFGVKPAEKTKVLFATGKLTNRSKLLRSFCSRYGMYRVCLPSILRFLQNTEAEKQSDLVQHCLKQGRSVPAQVTLKLVWREIERRNYLGSFLVEGFPTTVEEIGLWKERMLDVVDIRGIIYFTTGTDIPQERELRTKLMTFEAPFYYINSQLSDEKAAGDLIQKFQEDPCNVPVIRKSRSPKIMMVVGAPGTGKGSQCQRLRKDFGFDYISTAELLKTEISERRIYSELIEQHISAGRPQAKTGRLVPSEILVRLVKRYVFENRVGGRTPLILDGFPRNLANMQCWQDEVGDEIQLTNILHFHCSQRIMEERLINTKNSRNLKETPQIIVKRFHQYQKETQPVLDEYRQIALTVDSQSTVEEVSHHLREVMQAKGYRLLLPA